MGLNIQSLSGFKRIRSLKDLRIIKYLGLLVLYLYIHIKPLYLNRFRRKRDIYRFD